jgi:hypothetical protein
MKLTYLLAGALVLVSSGCKTDKNQQQQQEAFFPDTARSSVHKFERSQTAKGARTDGMLYAHHFDGENLNTLGKNKLGLMLGADTGAKVMKVYLVNVGTGDLLEKRKTAVTNYLKDGLRPDEKVEFVTGTNPDTYHPAAETIARVPKVESGEATASAPDSLLGGGTATGSPSMANAPGSTK